MRRIVMLLIISSLLLTSAGIVSSQDGSPTPGVIRGDHTGYTLFTALMSNQVYLVDSQGRIVHDWTVSSIGADAILRENGNLVVATGHVEMQPAEFARSAGPPVQLAGRLEEYTWDGDLLWAYEFDQPGFEHHHAIKVMPNGNILLIAWNFKSNEEAIAAGRNPDYLGEEGIWPDSVFEYSPEQNAMVWEWHTWDHLVQDFDPAKENYGVVADNPQLVDLNYFFAALAQVEDWQHTNGIDYNADLDQIALSVPVFNEVWIIDHSITTEEARGEAGDLLYRWGNPAAYDRGEVGDYQISFQHDVRWIPEGYPGAGNITVFSNQHVSDPDVAPADVTAMADHSRVVEITPPLLPDGTYALDDGQPYGPAEPTWVYGNDQETEHFYSFAISGALRLANGNTLITEGIPGRLLEVTPDNQIAWEYQPPFTQNAFLLPDSPASARQLLIFRVHRYEPDYPGLAGRDLSGGVFPAELATTGANYPALLRTGYGHETTLSSDFPTRYYATQVTQDEVNEAATYLFDVEVIDGNIDPVITITSPQGDVLAEDDNSGGERNALVADFAPADPGWLYVTVSHAGDDLTDVEGTFRVTRKIAGLFADVAPEIPQIVYGTAIQDFISDDDIESLFAFYGDAGDQVTIRMQRDNGSLDPVVELLDADQAVLVSAAAETDTPVALIEAYTLPESGVYYIRTTRYSGDARPSDTTGVYTVALNLAEAQ